MQYVKRSPKESNSIHIVEDSVFTYCRLRYFIDQIKEKEEHEIVCITCIDKRRNG